MNDLFDERAIVARVRTRLRWEFLGEDLFLTPMRRHAAVFASPEAAFLALREALMSRPGIDGIEFELRETSASPWPRNVAGGTRLFRGPMSAAAKVAGGLGG